MRSRCAVCGQEAYRDKSGRMMLHTIIVTSGAYGERKRAEICEGSDKGARP